MDSEATLPPPGFFEEFAAATPPMTGADYLAPELLGLIWSKLGRTIGKEVGKGGRSPDLPQGLNPAWQIVGRGCFHLAELKDDRETPVAFLAVPVGND